MGISVIKPFDFKGVAGKMLRGRNVYRGGATVPNITGFNAQKTAKLALKRRYKK